MSINQHALLGPQHQTGKDDIWLKVLSLELVFEMRKHYSFGTGQQCQSNAGTCLPGVHASQSDSLPLQQWRGSSEQRCAHPKGCRGLLCCLQILQGKQGVVLLDHVWQPKLFRPPLCLNLKSGCTMSMIQDVQSATTRLA